MTLEHFKAFSNHLQTEDWRTEGGAEVELSKLNSSYSTTCWICFLVYSNDCESESSKKLVSGEIVHQVRSRHWSSARSLPRRLFRHLTSASRRREDLCLLLLVPYLLSVKSHFSASVSVDRPVQATTCRVLSTWKEKEKHGTCKKQISHFQTTCHSLEGLNPPNNAEKGSCFGCKKAPSIV